MDRLMASGRPAGALLNVAKARVVDRTDDEAVAPVLGKVALQAKVCIWDFQHLGVDAAMYVMTGGAALAECLVFKHEWTGICGVAFSTRSTGGLQNTLGEQALVVRAVWIMAVDAGHLAIRDRVAVRQGKLALDIEVALQAGGRVFTRIMDQVASAAFLRMQAAGTMAGLAAKLQAGLVINHQAGMDRVFNIPANVIVTETAVFATDKIRSGRLGNRKHRPVD